MFRPPRFHVRCLLSTLFAVLLAAVLLVLPAAPANAAAPHADLDCTITLITDVHPPITPELRHHAVTSHGLTGTADCTGTVDGHQVTGAGTFGIYTQGPGSCATGSSSGTFVLRIPTTGGTMTVTGRYESTFGDLPGGGAVFTGDLTGPVAVVAADGDCVNTPITHTTAVFTGTVTT
jgi:hypothetical protein